MRRTSLVGVALCAFGFSQGVRAQTSDVSLDMVVNNPAPVVDEIVTFTITLTNDGPDDTLEVGIAHTLPAELSFVSATPSNGSYDDSINQWSAVLVASGTSVTLDVDALVVQEGAGGASLIHTAEVVFADLPDPDSTPDNGDDTEDDWAEASVTVDTSAENAPPVANDMTTTIRTEADSVDILLDATDPDDDELEYTVADNGNAYEGLDVDFEGPEPNHFVVTTYVHREEDLTFTFHASDGIAQSNEATVRVRHRPGKTSNGLCFSSIAPNRSPRGASVTLSLLALALVITFGRRLEHKT